MWRMITGLLPGRVWAFLAAVALVVIVGGWLWLDRVRLAAERDAAQTELAMMIDKRDSWRDRAHQAEADRDDARQRRREAEAAVAALQDELAADATDYWQLRERIRQAPAEDDGPVAPVLRQALEDLP
ncbi:MULTISPECIES: hypothetical protein [Halomonas]|uniref:Uncharacterized protein n=1 Tax=Halomonas halophila TaxID=29573 RepID=A0ABQ0TZW6_9GAMM|nr:MULTISPECIES: hypothetical protein [Halomonas]MDR5889651.1 hypothetical protein [Halomonas salina]WJY06333.1 hypothetical protein QWG60_11505 [Halomonas halophila]GEK71580.1 hypothetical protein HHA04nite_01240 [Halomonas halophila]